MAWQGAPPYYQDPNQQYYGGQPGYPPNAGYPPNVGYPPNPGYPPQGGGYPPPAGGYPPPAGGYAPQPGFVPPQPPYGQIPHDQPGYGTGYQDPESGYDDEVKGFGFSDESIRRGFIRKVYSILMCQLLVTFGFVAVCTFHEPTQLFVKRNPSLMWIALAVLLVTIISMACCSSVRRKAPMNLIFLALFTLAESFLMGMVASNYKSEAVLMAVGITAVICLALTLFAFQTKWDFTVMGGVLFVALIIFVLFGIVAIFFRSHTTNMIYASLGALLFSFYLVYDTQLMMGGKHKYSISPEEYIFAALNLYLDIINIFMYILTIVGSSKN